MVLVGTHDSSIEADSQSTSINLLTMFTCGSFLVIFYIHWMNYMNPLNDSVMITTA